MLATEELTDAQWQIADAIARQLVIEGTDVNELRKAMSYLRDRRDQADAGKKFFDYLKTLVRHGNAIGHSKRTLGYYQSLDAVCSQYLANYQDDPLRMLHILSWAARLVQYYDKGVPTGEIEQPSVMSEREAEIQAVTQAQSFQLDQTLDAVVSGIKGNKVTYEILGTIKLTVKEPKKASSLSEGQPVTVKVTGLKDDGSLKNVKFFA
ncbi:MAG: hypothetical protein ACFBSF_18255 [Leptolyngbyaceae cyanobacterium]